MVTPLRNLSCPGCEGAIKWVEGKRVTDCPYCGCRLLIQEKERVERFYIFPSLSEERVISLLVRLFEDKTTAGDLVQEAQIKDISLFFVPLYEHIGLRIAKIFSPRRVDTRVSISDFRHLYPACSLPQWGVNSIEIPPQGEEFLLTPYNRLKVQEKGMIFDPILTPSEVLKKGRERTKKEVGKQAQEMEIVEESLILIYYPLWVARYLYKDRLYQAVVDGVRGIFLRARFPEDERYRVFFILLFIMLLSFGAGWGGPLWKKAFKFIFLKSSPGYLTWYLLLVLLGGFTFLVGALAFLWNKFRYWGEVQVINGAKQVVKINKSRQTKLKKLYSKLLDIIAEAIKRPSKGMRDEGT